MALALGSQGFRVESHDGFLLVENHKNDKQLEHTLAALANGTSIDIFAHDPKLLFEKFHRYLTVDLQQQDTLACRVDIPSLNIICNRLINENNGSKLDS